MAISHAHLILLPLLTLFFLPILRAVPFEICGRETDLFEVNGVEMIQNGFKITGVSSDYVFEGSMELTVGIGKVVVMHGTFNLCDHMINCGVGPGGTFEIFYDNMPPDLSSIKLTVRVLLYNIDATLACITFDYYNGKDGVSA